jgi:hypothetical protein
MRNRGDQKTMKPDRHNPPSKFLFSILLAIFIFIPQNSQTADFPINHNPQSYVLTKLKSHDIILLGTRHKQSPILKFISDLITVLHNSGVTRTGLSGHIYWKSAGSCVFFQYRLSRWINVFFSAIDPLMMLP